MAQLMLLSLTDSCFNKIQIDFTFLVPADPGSPGKRTVKRVFVFFISKSNTVFNIKFGNTKGSRCFVIYSFG